MARNDEEISLMLEAYDLALEHLYKIDQKSTEDVLKTDCIGAEISLDRWLYLVVQTFNVQLDDNDPPTPEYHKIPGITDDEIEALHSVWSLQKFRKHGGKIERYAIAAAIFNARLERDKKRGKRLTAKFFNSGDSFGRSLRRYMPDT